MALPALVQMLPGDPGDMGEKFCRLQLPLALQRPLSTGHRQSVRATWHQAFASVESWRLELPVRQASACHGELLPFRLLPACCFCLLMLLQLTQPLDG